MINKLLIIFVLFSFVLGQVGRITIGNNISFTLLDIAVFSTVISFLLKNWRKVPKLPLLKPFFSLIVVFILSLLINANHYQPLQLLAALLYTVRYIQYFFLFYFFNALSKKEKQFAIFGVGVAGASIVFLGFVQYAFYQNLRNLYYLGWDDHLYRLFSTFLDPNFAGAFYVLFLLFLFPFIQESISRKQQIKSIVFILLATITFIALLLTFSRSALIMLVVSVITYLVFIGKKKFIYLLFGLLVFYVYAISSKSYLENMNLFRIASTEARFSSVREALTIIHDHPIFGVGFDAYRYAQVSYGFRKPTPPVASNSDAGTDNSFLFVLATVGIIGFIVFCYFWKKVFDYINHKKTRNASKLFTAIIVGLFINSLFINNLFYAETLCFWWMLLGVYGE